MDGFYNDLLQEDSWKTFAADLKARRGGRCECCGSPEALEVHHLKYPDDKMDEVAYRNEKFLIVLCRNCHECFTHCLTRFKQQTYISDVISFDTARCLIKKSVKELYTNSLYKAATKATIRAFSPHEYSCVRDMLVNNVRLMFSDIEYIDENGKFRQYLPTVSQEESGVFEWRNAEIMRALDEGYPPTSIKKRFRISDSAFKNALNNSK